MKLCTECRHSVSSEAPDDDGKLKCARGNIRNPINGHLFAAEKVRLIGVAGYQNGTEEMSGLVACAPIGNWWEPN